MHPLDCSIFIKRKRLPAALNTPKPWRSSILMDPNQGTAKAGISAPISGGVPKIEEAARYNENKRTVPLAS